MKLSLALLILISVGCSHKKDGWIIKAQDGRLYRLQAIDVEEGYSLMEIPDSAINYFHHAEKMLNDSTKPIP